MVRSPGGQGVLSGPGGPDGQGDQDGQGGHSSQGGLGGQGRAVREKKKFSCMSLSHT